MVKSFFYCKSCWADVTGPIFIPNKIKQSTFCVKRAYPVLINIDMTLILANSTYMHYYSTAVM